MTTVTIIEFDDAGNVVSETESRVFSPETPEELEALFDADGELDDAGIDDDFDHDLDDSENWQDFVAATSYHGGGA